MIGLGPVNSTPANYCLVFMNLFSVVLLLLLSSVACASLLDCFKHLLPGYAAEIAPERENEIISFIHIPSNTKFYDVEISITIESGDFESMDPDVLKRMINKYTDKAVAEARNIIRSHPELLDQLQDDVESHNDINVVVSEPDDHKTPN